MIPLSLVVVLPVVSSAVFLSIDSSLIAVGLGSNIELLSRGFSFRHDGGEGGRWKREREKEAGNHALSIKLRVWRNGVSTPLSICLSDPQGREEAVAQEGAKNSVKNGVHFERAPKPRGAHLTHPSLTWLTLLARCEVLKRHGVGERESEPGADFGSLRLPSCRIPVPITPGTRQMCPHNLP